VGVVVRIMGRAPLLGKSSIAPHPTEGPAGCVSAFGENLRATL